MQLRDYQTQAINELARKSTQGKRRLLLQLATGGGKTVMFSGLVKRFLSRYPDQRIVILVHREELLKQARKTLYEWYGIIACPVVAGMRHLPDAQVYVAMVETANNRLRKSPDYFGNVGLLIVDEAHLGSFRKLLTHFPCLTIGFTATPISASKKEPLKGIYEDIVCGVDIPDLIHQGALMPNRTYHIKNINRKDLAVRAGEFDEKVMSTAYSRPKQVHNTIDGYRKHCLGMKTLVFNCNVEHSKLVCAAFQEAGFPCRHLDGTSTDRAETVAWFANTPRAILCNIGVLTTGFDQPSVECVIMNKATMSLPLWLQCTGRGSRPHPGKSSFTILDLGGNALTHGDWSASRDWKDIFENPDKPSDGKGVAPIKCCNSCEAIIPASKAICPYCGADNSKGLVIDDALVEFELLTEAKPWIPVIDVPADKSPYYGLHQVIQSLLQTARREWGMKALTDPLAYKLLELFQDQVKVWCKANKKPYNHFHQTVPTEWLFKELKRVYGWEPNEIKLEVA